MVDPAMIVADPCGLWKTLASAGPKAIAEALDADEIRRLHVETGLESFVEAKVREGFSVVLTGNAGDGKTHVLRRASEALTRAGAVVVADATAHMSAGDVGPLLDMWCEAEARGRPFCLAANEYPLYQMRSTATPSAQVQEVSRQCRDRLSYGLRREREAAWAHVLVVDLSLRNPLNPAFFDRLLDRILSDPGLASAVAAGRETIASRNLALVSERRVRERLGDLMRRMVSFGHRATIRELWILAARMVFAEPSDRSVSSSFSRADWYSETLFAPDPRFDFTRALRDVDPARCSHPTWDALIEVNAPALRGGWIVGPPAIPPHPDLDAASFSALKRRFFFEHESGPGILDLADPDGEDFRRLLTGERATGRLVVAAMVDAVNAAFCPVRFEGRGEHLYLWTGHRFHEQPSRSFVAAERLRVDDFTVEVPRLPLRLEGCFDYHPDHLALTATVAGEEIRLRIDFPLFQTLRRLARGLPRKLVPERDIHRLDTFLERLAAVTTGDRCTIWSVNLEAMEIIQVSLSPDRRRYEGVRRIA